MNRLFKLSILFSIMTLWSTTITASRTSPPSIPRQLLPHEIHITLVDALSKTYDVSPSYIMGTIETESNFKADAVSHSGALGLMQIMPRTAREEIEQYSGAAHNISTVKSLMVEYSSLNIIFGVRYISKLNRMFKAVKNVKKRQVLVSASYNAGFGRLTKAFRCKNVKCVIYKTNKYNIDKYVNRLPNETRRYIPKIALNTQRYAQVFDGR